METSEYFVAEIWLLSGNINRFLRILTLKNNRLIMTAIDPRAFWESGLKKTEKKLGVENFFSLINKGKLV